MELDGILYIIIFVAIFAFNIIVPIIKSMKERDEVEQAHKNRPRPARTNSAPLRRAPENTGRRFEAFPPSPPRRPPTFEPATEFFEVPRELKEAYKNKNRPNARKERRQSETPQEALERVSRENIIAQARKREAGEICDECYDMHQNDGKYAAIMRNHSSLVDAFVASEILGKPLSLRGDGGVFESKF